MAGKPRLSPVQFSIAAILGLTIVVGAVLAVFRISIFGGCVFAAIVLPALLRAYWAESLRKRAGVRAAQGDAVGAYFVSLAIMMLIGALTLATGGAAYVAAELAADWNNPGNGPLAFAALVSSVVFIGLFWLTRPRAQHYLP